MAKLLTWGGAVIFAIGLIALPDDLDSWWQRLEDVGDMANDNPLAAFAILLGLVLIGFANRDSLVDIVRGRRRWKSDEELGNELHDWLRRASYTITEAPTPESSDVSFVFAAERTGQKTRIMKAGGAGRLFVRGHIAPQGEFAKVIAKMGTAAMASMIDDISIEMARFGVSFNASAKILDQGITVEHSLAIADSLVRSQFLEKVGFVERAILLVQVVISRHVRQFQVVSGETVTPVPQSTLDT